MIKIKSKKGITLVSLIMTVIILLILSTITVITINPSNNLGSYNKMLADISLLRDKVLIYYNKYEEIPKTTRSIKLFESEIEYWEIDLNKLGGITLNFGKGFRKDRRFSV